MYGLHPIHCMFYSHRGGIYHILRLHGIVCVVVLWVAACALHKSTGRDILRAQYPLGNGFLVAFISTCLNGFFCCFLFFLPRNWIWRAQKRFFVPWRLCEESRISFVCALLYEPSFFRLSDFK